MIIIKEIKSAREATPSSLLTALRESLTKGAMEQRMTGVFAIILPCNQNK
jgi:hypothetical protein